jgi:hypothetical protein
MRASGAAAGEKREKGAGGGESKGAAVGLPVAERGERRREAERSGAAGAERSCGGEAEHCGRIRALRGGAEASGRDGRRGKRKADGWDPLVSHPGGR